jgi:fatty-acyl-CoA synthase
LTHHNILNNGFFIGEAMRLTQQDRLCIPVPLYHCFGMVLGNLACVTHGAAMAVPGEGFDPKAVLETVQAERCTALCVPTMFIAILDHPDFTNTTCRTCVPASWRLALPDGSRDAGHRIDAHGGNHHCIWHDGNVARRFQTATEDPREMRVSSIGRSTRTWKSENRRCGRRTCRAAKRANCSRAAIP